MTVLRKVNSQYKIWLSLTLVLAVAGVVAVLYHTWHGPGATGDSAYYLMGATNLLAGDGFSRFSGGWEVIPITGFPPVYSLILTIPGLLGMDLVVGARLLNALLFGVNIFLVSLLLYRYTRSPYPALLGALFALADQTMLHYHAWVMSEGLFIFFILLALYFLSRYFDRPAIWTLAVASMLISLSALTRYVGLSLGAAAGLGILFFARLPWRRKITDILLLSAICLLPVMLWFWRNSTIGGSAINRQLAYHPMSMELTVAFLREMVSWFIPHPIGLSTTLRGLILLIAAAGIFSWLFLTRKKDLLPDWHQSWGSFRFLPWLVALLIPVYLLAIVANTTLLDASTSIQAATRYLLPIYIVSIVLAICVAYRLFWSKPGWDGAKIVMLVVAALLLVFSLGETVTFIRQPGSAFGYTDNRRTWTEVTSTLQAIPPEKPILSNNVEMIYIMADRPAYALPISFDHYTQQARQDFDQQIVTAKQRLDQGAVIVIINPLDDEQREILDLLGVEESKIYPQATFYVKANQ